MERTPWPRTVAAYCGHRSQSSSVRDVDGFLFPGRRHARAVAEGVLDFIHRLGGSAAAGNRCRFPVPEEGDSAEDLVAGFREAARGYARQFAQELLDVGAAEHQFMEVLIG